MPRRSSAARRLPRRPGRATRPALSRDSILDAAIGLVRRGGVEGLTIRKLAAALGVSPMAVYHHFDGRESIVLGVIDRVVADAAVTAHGTSPRRWQDWLRATFRGMHRALVAQPGLVPLIGHSLRVGPSALGVLDEVLGVLRAAGIEGAAAVRAYQSLMAYTLGAATLSATAAGDGRPLDERAAEEAAEAAATLPHLQALADDLRAFRRSDAFEDGLDVVLAGVEASLAAG